MKVKIKRVPYEYAKAIQPPKRKKLKKPSFLFRLLIRILSIFELKKAKFSYEKVNMKKAGKGPYLILMNHSSFIDLKIASKLFFPKPYYIVSTTDAFVGKSWLMRQIGCIPTQKFVTDLSLTRDMYNAVTKKKISVLLFPEAGYSFDGRTTTLPKRLGVLVKKLGVPIVSVITDGAFLYQPLYNELNIRKAKVSAKMECLLSAEEVKNASVEEIDGLIDKAFSFDNFKAQAEQGVKISELFRANGLQRILYRCPACHTEGQMQGEGITLSCKCCGKTYEMDEYGKLCAKDGETEFAHIPDWYAWQRECVKKELETGTYRQELDVEIGIITDHKAVYMVGEGKLVHDEKGFALNGCNGALQYDQSPLSSYSLNSDFYWYEIGDVIGIGDKRRLYYCFPKQKDVVTNARLAAEELYKLLKAKALST